MIISDKIFKKKVFAMYDEWANEYRKAFKKKEDECYEVIDLEFENQWESITDYFGYMAFDGNIENLKQIKKFLKRRLEDQIEFIMFYLRHMILDGNSEENLGRIKKFLSLQKADSKGKLEIHFMGGSPLEIIVHVNKIKEIDFADTHGIINFDSICVFRKDKRWTQKSADECYEAIKDDFEFDGCTFVPYSYHFSDNALYFDSCKIA